MDETVTASPLPQEPTADSFLTRAVGIFISPGRTFESIVRRPDFLAPLIIAIVGSIALSEAMLGKIGAAAIVRHALEAQGKASQMTPEQLDTAVHRAAAIVAISMRAAGVLFVPIYLLVIAAVGLFIANVLFGASANFKTSFCVVCYASLVLQVAVILALVIIFMGDPAQFNTENPIPSTVGFFLNPHETSKALYSIASSFDIFRIWFIILCAMGLSAATGKKAGTAAILFTYLGIWILIVLGKAGWAVMMG